MYEISFTKFYITWQTEVNGNIIVQMEGYRPTNDKHRLTSLLRRILMRQAYILHIFKIRNKRLIKSHHGNRYRFISQM